MRSSPGRLASLLGGDGNHLWTAFGPTNVAAHELSVLVEVGDLTAATRVAAHQDMRGLPRERQVRHDLEVARIWTATGRDADAVDLVAAAEQQAPDQVRHHFITRALLDTWLHHPIGHRRAVGQLAHRVRLEAAI
ncbi:MAG: hypothetical protein HYR62_06085 [Actinobacteria bacterium]|nr:hypothetical protein [Actinomycetota bacterium]